MVSIIIPAYHLIKKTNPKFFYKKKFSLADTIDSIVRTIDVDYEIIVVVNNQSDQELVEYIKKSKYINKYCIINQNVGVARAWNIGANLSEGGFLCFCNDDVEFKEKNTFSSLLNVLTKDKMIGEIGPEGGKWNRDLSGMRTGLNKLEEADEISGFFFIIPSIIYFEVGGFDNFYTPAGVEEIDMSFKLRSLGYKCIVMPNTGIVHHGNHGISSKTVDISYMNKIIGTKDLDKRNKEYFVKKWYPND